MKSFPVTESTLSAEHLAAFVSQTYGLHSVTCRLFRTGMNHLYMVTDGDQRFVLRVYTHQWRTRIEIAEEIKLLNHLKKNQVSVAYPIASRQGAFIQELNAPEGTRYAVLFMFAEGQKNPRFSADASYKIGVTMAHLHQVTLNFPLDRIRYNPQTLFVDSFQKTSSFFGTTSDEMIFVQTLTQYLHDEYTKVDINQLRSGALHLDIWFDNLHFNEANEVTLFDFDFCGSGWLCHDVAYFLFQLYNTNLNEEEYKTKAASFQKGYESVTTLTNEEKRILPITGLAVFLFFLSMQVDRYDTWSNIFLNEDHLKRFVGMLKKWCSLHRLPI